MLSGNDGVAPGLFHIPADGGAPVRLLNGLHFHPVWSPDGRFIVYAEGEGGGGDLRVKAITPEGTSCPFPVLQVNYGGGDAYCFLPGGKALLVRQGGTQGLPQNFWVLDLPSGSRRQVTSLRATGVIGSFDISADGRSILFDRTQANADIVLIDRPEG